MLSRANECYKNVKVSFWNIAKSGMAGAIAGAGIGLATAEPKETDCAELLRKDGSWGGRFNEGYMAVPADIEEWRCFLKFVTEMSSSYRTQLGKYGFVEKDTSSWIIAWTLAGGAVGLLAGAYFNCVPKNTPNIIEHESPQLNFEIPSRT